MEGLLKFLHGATSMTAFVIGLLFLKFWRRTRDRMFALFAGSFWLEAINHVVIASNDKMNDDRLAPFVLRLFTYVLILVAIWDKNRPGGQS